MVCIHVCMCLDLTKYILKLKIMNTFEKQSDKEKKYSDKPLNNFKHYVEIFLFSGYKRGIKQNVYS